MTDRTSRRNSRRNSQLRVTPPTVDDYARAASLLWGEAGEFAVREFDRLNRELLAGELPPLPIVINLTAYGGCIGATRPPGRLQAPRITLAPGVFNRGGKRMVSDVLLHEMCHAALILRGKSAAHSDDPWCELISELSVPLLGREIVARPVRPRRIPNPARAHDPTAPKTIVVRRHEDGALSQADLATWPHPLRPAAFYADQPPLRVPTY